MTFAATVSWMSGVEQGLVLAAWRSDAGHATVTSELERGIRKLRKWC